jgi:HPt (histidine-containing phosphotransfer) domain-containing protein
MTKQTAIDTNFLREIVSGDKEFEKELFAIFSDNAHRNFIKMEDSIKNQDNNSWYMASHAFKGAAASIGAFGLSQLLEHAQQFPEESFEEKQLLLKKIHEEFRLVLEFINEETL